MTRPSPAIADYYQILGLPFPSSSANLSKQQIKLAYHKALLKHHPDKAHTISQETHLAQDKPSIRTSTPLHPRPNDSTQQITYTIDEITTAYKTLSTPSLRTEYDRALRLDRTKTAQHQQTGDVFHTGLEVVDLEDLSCDEGDAENLVWYRGCRCGDERGFLVGERELEREVEAGEIVVGCRGCSLWLKVLFAAENGGVRDQDCALELNGS